MGIANFLIARADSLISEFARAIRKFCRFCPVARLQDELRSTCIFVFGPLLVAKDTSNMGLLSQSKTTILGGTNASNTLSFIFIFGTRENFVSRCVETFSSAPKAHIRTLFYSFGF